jgi:four helix bundle protein
MRTVSSTAIRTFEDLECWNRCRVLRLFVAKHVVPILPREERYKLSDQMLRAARATAANIAEGYGRFHCLDNAKFCSNARGSCWETLDHLITGSDESFIATELLNQGRTLVNEAVKVLNGYMNYLKRAHRTRSATNNE